MNAAAHPLATGDRWVTFCLDAHRYALPLDSVSRIVRAAEITPLPQAPAGVAGVIDVGGRVLPVFDLRFCLGLPRRALALSDQFILARTSYRDVVIIADQVLGLVDAPAAKMPDVTDTGSALTLPDGLVLIQDLESFLTPSEDEALEAALRREEAQRAR